MNKISRRKFSGILAALLVVPKTFSKIKSEIVESFPDWTDQTVTDIVTCSGSCGKLYEAMLFEKRLTVDEIEGITQYFQRKYYPTKVAITRIQNG